MKYILVNPLSNNSRGEEALDKVLELVKEESEVLKITQINLKDFVKKLSSSDDIILVGGDGTINNFVNKYVNYTSPVGFVIYLLLIFVFSFFYTFIKPFFLQISSSPFFTNSQVLIEPPQTSYLCSTPVQIPT